MDIVWENDPDFINIQIERQTKKVDEWREKAPSSPFHRDALAVEEALLDGMRAAMERLYAPPATDDEAPAAPAGKPNRQPPQGVPGKMTTGATAPARGPLTATCALAL